MTASDTTNPLSSLALLCSEDIPESTADNCSTLSNSILSSEPFVELWDGVDDHEELSFLLDKEQETQIEGNPSLAVARVEAVSWILEVSECCSFSALTAVLAVNYLDRFLCSFQSQSDSEKLPWMSQLAAVACLSLAAKVEETQVPLLLDLQLVNDSEYVFESKTIQRMEILVLSTLEWKMNPVTPFPFLDYIARRLPLDGHLCREFLRRCECRILSVMSDHRFVSYLPSALAAAAMLSVMSRLNPFAAMQDRWDQLAGLLGINKAGVEECCRLMQVTDTRSDHFHSIGNKRKFGSLPGSPKGVADVSFSSDASTDSSPAGVSPASVSSSRQPLSKKIKPQSPNRIPH